MQDDTFSHIDGVLADVDRYLDENQSSLSDTRYSRQIFDINKNNKNNLVSKAQNDINTMLQKFNLEKIEPYRPQRATFNFETDNSFLSDDKSFSFDGNIQYTDSPSYKFTSKSQNIKSQSPISDIQSRYTSKIDDFYKKQNLYTDYSRPSSYIGSQHPKKYTRIQTAEQIEIEMLKSENIQMIQELNQCKAQLEQVQQRNSELLKLLEENECELYKYKKGKK